MALAELGGHVAVKLSAPSLQHKADVGALVLDVRTEEAVRDGAPRARRARRWTAPRVLVERMAPPGAELLVAARADAVVPCLVVGAGGVWTEALDDAAVVPLPADARAGRGGASHAARRRALHRRPRPPGARRARPPPGSPLRPASSCSRADLELLELNPVLVHEQGAVAVDAVAVAPGTVHEDGRRRRRASPAWWPPTSSRAAASEVVVLEARSRVGGRVWSERLPNGAVVEMGAEFILPGNTAIRELVDRFGLGLWDKGMRYGRRDPRGGIGDDARGARRPR